MKKNILVVSTLSLALSACGVYDFSRFPVGFVSMDEAIAIGIQQNSNLAGSHWADVAKVRAEAQRLGVQIREGKLTKVQAAQMLNKYRIALVGNNDVDDAVYEVYQRAAVESQRGAITPEQSREEVENALRGWQQRWPNMKSKPSNPAFTNFLLEYMKLKPLR